MTAIDLPPVRRLIRPDPGFVLVDADFDRADAQAVAWYADELELKHVFQTGVDIHQENAAWIYYPSEWTYNTPLAFSKVTPDQRQRSKNGIHLTDYGGKARTLASTLNTTVHRAEEFQSYWFDRFPGIKRWHTSVDQRLRLAHCVYNVWGFRRFYFDRIDTKTLLPQALAWLGQSTIAVAINKAMLRVHHELPEAQLLLQNHDSLLMQVPARLAPAIFPVILDTMRVKVPFDDPLFIPLSLKWSEESWGQMRKWSPPAAKEINRAA